MEKWYQWQPISFDLIKGHYRPKKIPDYYDRKGNLREGWKAGQGGHFITGAICPPPLYFHEKNVHCQCYQCNINLSGNWFNYERKMLQVYGQSVVDELKSMAHLDIQWNHALYEEKIRYYKQKLSV